MIELQNISKRYGNKTVFQQLTKSFQPGKITYITAPSGRGKTTLLRLIAGLERPDSGKIERDETVAYVFQEPRLFPWMCVGENLKVVNDDEEKIREILALLELDGEYDSRIETLSGGMQQRVAIARALLFPAEIYLFDEPFKALDEAMRERLIPTIYTYLNGKTVLVVSHDLAEAERFADEVYSIK